MFDVSLVCCGVVYLSTVVLGKSFGTALVAVCFVGCFVLVLGE